MSSRTGDAARSAAAAGGASRSDADGECLLVARTPGAADGERLLAACLQRGLAARWAHPAERPPPATRAVLLPRLPSGTPADTLDVLEAWERAGALVINPPSALRLAHDKFRALAALEAAGIDVPPTLCVRRDGPATLEALRGDSFVIKPLAGCAGHGVTVGLTRAQAQRCAAAFADASGPVLVQPFLGGGIDRRLFVVGGRLVAAMERRPAPGLGRGNLRYGAHATPFVPEAEDAALAGRALRALGLHVAAVDLLRDNGRSLVLEVNTCPGLHGIEAATGKDVAGALADALLAARRLQQT